MEGLLSTGPSPSSFITQGLQDDKGFLAVYIKTFAMGNLAPPVEFVDKWLLDVSVM